MTNQTDPTPDGLPQPLQDILKLVESRDLPKTEIELVYEQGEKGDSVPVLVLTDLEYEIQFVALQDPLMAEDVAFYARLTGNISRDASNYVKIAEKLGDYASERNLILRREYNDDRTVGFGLGNISHWVPNKTDFQGEVSDVLRKLIHYVTDRTEQKIILSIFQET